MVTFDRGLAGDGGTALGRGCEQRRADEGRIGRLSARWRAGPLIRRGSRTPITS